MRKSHAFGAVEGRHDRLARLTQTSANIVASIDIVNGQIVVIKSLMSTAGHNSRDIFQTQLDHKKRQLDELTQQLEKMNLQTPRDVTCIDWVKRAAGPKVRKLMHLTVSKPKTIIDNAHQSIDSMQEQTSA